MEYHEIANIFPMMADKELSALAEDIKQNGLQNKIILHEGKILDGRNRFQACRMAGIKPQYEEYNGADPMRTIISLNLRRRHLDESQRAVIAARVATLQDGQRADYSRSADLPTLTQAEAAELFNVSERMIRTVKAIEREAPERIVDIESGGMSATKVYNLVKREQSQLNAPQPLPDGKYRVIYSDPPWSYGNSGLHEYGHAERHYPTMTVKELCALPVRDFSADDSVLFLWTTSPMLEDAFTVLNAWGFDYKTSFVWDKVKHNFGYYNSVRHEFLLVCTRGQCTPDVDKKHDSVIALERSSRHSEKPEYFREMICSIYTYGKKIEMFARKSKDGWDSWGNEILGRAD